MLLLAAAANVKTRFADIPTDVWVKLGVGLLALVALVIVLRKVAKMNKVLLGAIVFVGLTILGFNWIYERNEPKWATPIVAKLAEFFPSKGRER